MMVVKREEALKREKGKNSKMHEREGREAENRTGRRNNEGKSEKWEM